MHETSLRWKARNKGTLKNTRQAFTGNTRLGYTGKHVTRVYWKTPHKAALENTQQKYTGKHLTRLHWKTPDMATLENT